MQIPAIFRQKQQPGRTFFHLSLLRKTISQPVINNSGLPMIASSQKKILRICKSLAGITITPLQTKLIASAQRFLGLLKRRGIFSSGDRVKLCQLRNEWIASLLLLQLARKSERS